MKHVFSATAATGVLTAIVFGLLAHSDFRAQREAKESAHAEQAAARLIAASDQENSACRGGAMPQAAVHCDRRDAIDQQLRQLGYCYGEGAEYSYQAVWRKCGEAALDAAAADAAARDAALAADEARRPSHFTKAEFSNHVYGMTKAQVRAQFGSPLVVHDSDGSWFYGDLPVYDADAGIQVPATLMFMGVGGPEDEVVGVKY